MKDGNLFFLLSASARSNVPGFWAMDLSSELRTTQEKDYTGYWISAAKPEFIKPLASPPVSLDVGLNSQGKRCVTASLGGVPQNDPEPEFVIANMIQRRFFIYASNQVSPLDLPTFLSKNPSGRASPIHLLMRPAMRMFWDSPDVRLGVVRKRYLMTEGYQRIAQRIDKRFGPNSSANYKPLDPTLEYERVARVTTLYPGLFLPVSFEASGSVFDAVLHLDTDMSHGDVQATLFCDDWIEPLKLGTEIYRHVSFDYASDFHESTDLVGTVQ